jgi:hypothetical protein
MKMFMIQDRREIRIESSPEIIFDVIDKMPNKFPVYRILETKPFFFIRVLFVDGFKAAIEAAGIEKPYDVLILNVGDTMGPFTLTGKEKPIKYWFTLKSFFFNCQTGYSLSFNGSETTLCFDLIAEDPSFKEKVWWLLFKPFHWIFANKSLSVIKSKIM